jgi:hypothetical protein
MPHNGRQHRGRHQAGEQTGGMTVLSRPSWPDSPTSQSSAIHEARAGRIARFLFGCGAPMDPHGAGHRRRGRNIQCRAPTTSGGGRNQVSCRRDCRSTRRPWHGPSVILPVEPHAQIKKSRSFLWTTGGPTRTRAPSASKSDRPPGRTVRDRPRPSSERARAFFFVAAFLSWCGWGKKNHRCLGASGL